jgi:hypothetical protein
MASSSGTADGAWQTGTLSFIGPPVQVTVGSNQKVLVEGHAALGSTAGSQGLGLYICYQATGGGALTQAPASGLLDLTTPDSAVNQRFSFNLSSVVTPTAGTYDVGICGQANASWNSNGNAFNVAQVATVP